MSTCPPLPSKLPLHPEDGARICDKYGNIFQYETEIDSWLYRGIMTTPPTVTETTDGLVTPDIFQRLTDLKDDTADGIPPTLKLKPHPDAYYYFFDSSDRLIKFTQESQQDLRLEFNSSRFYSLVSQLSCRGDKGAPGPAGAAGGSGPLTTEPCFRPTGVGMSVSNDGLRWSFDISVLTPLTTDISLRIFAKQPDVFSDNNVSVTILIPFNGDQSKTKITYAASSPVSLDDAATISSIHYNAQSHRLTGTLIRQSGSWSIGTWCIRAKQRGPKGDTGADASCLMTVRSCTLPVGTARTTAPIVQLRQSCSDSNTILATTQNLFSTVCVRQLRFPINPGEIAAKPLIVGRFLAVSKQIDACKDLAAWTPLLDIPEAPELVLPAYSPSPNCQEHDTYSDLGWIPLTDEPANSDDWATIDGLSNKKYPWLIDVDPQPVEVNCDPCAKE